MSEPDHPNVLVVTKEPSLGSQSAAILETLGYHCLVMKAGTSEAKAEVREELARQHFDFAFAQQHMSPDSALDLLLHVNNASGAARPAMVCLAFDGSAHTAFIREGGASYVPLEPGEIELRAAIAQGLREATEYLLHLNTNRRKVLRHLGEYKREIDFQKFIVDIFLELNYFGVRLTHGMIERGKDIVCWEVNKLNQKEFVGIQVKMGDIHASAGAGDVTDLWRQSIEAFSTRVTFPDGKQYLDKFVVVTSGRINELAREKLSEFLRASYSHRRVLFLGQEEIADLVVSSCPSLMAGIR